MSDGFVTEEIRRPRPQKGSSPNVLLVGCHAGLHICKHRGSKPDLVLAKSKRRAKDKVAKASRRHNRTSK